MSRYLNKISLFNVQFNKQIKTKPCQYVIQKNLYVNTKLLRKYSTSQEQQGWTTWKGIFVKFIPVGLCLIAVMQWRAYRKYSGTGTAKNWEVSCYCALPLRGLSRCWGWIAEKALPENMRPYIYGWYSTKFGVNIKEAASEDFKSYECLGDFFARALKDGVRKIDNSSLVAPCDGRVLNFGIVKNGQIEQVKGVTYSLEEFLGYDELSSNNSNLNPSDNSFNYKTALLYKKDNSTSLYQCVLYLAPGDYHRFHSPTDWQPLFRRHFAGKLLSVNPIIASWIPGLFCLNERVSYLGKWTYGFFSYTAVGATNVGSVRVYFDKTLKTNQPSFRFKRDDKILKTNLPLQKAQCMGEFRMGSTIVLIFEAPNNFQFSLDVGQKVHMGQTLGYLLKTNHVDRVKNEENNFLRNAS